MSFIRELMEAADEVFKREKDEKEKKQIEFEQCKEKAIAIVCEGGPQNKEEYFFLFPEACRQCGSRTFRNTELIEAFQDIGYLRRTPVEPTCSNCSSYGYDSQAYYEYGAEIYFPSPYLTQDEENKAIKNWENNK